MPLNSDSHYREHAWRLMSGQHLSSSLSVWYLAIEKSSWLCTNRNWIPFPRKSRQLLKNVIEGSQDSSWRMWWCADTLLGFSVWLDGWSFCSRILFFWESVSYFVSVGVAQIILSVAEHHSNLVPWQLLAQRMGVVLRFVGLTSEETLDLEQLRGLINERTKLVSLFHISNVLGMDSPMFITNIHDSYCWKPVAVTHCERNISNFLAMVKRAYKGGDKVTSFQSYPLR